MPRPQSKRLEFQHCFNLSLIILIAYCFTCPLYSERFKSRSRQERIDRLPILTTLLRVRLKLILIFLAALALSGQSAVASSQTSPDAGFQEAIRLRVTLDAERRDWQRQRAILESERSLLEKSIAEIDDAIARRAGQTSELDSIRSELLREQESLRDWEIDRDVTLDHLVRMLEAIPPRFPDAGPLQPLPAAPESEDSGEHLRLLLGWLSDAVDTSRRIGHFQTLAEDTQGQRREVEAVHFGLGNLLFTTADGSFAGRLRLTQKDWQWQADPSVATPLLRQLRQLEGKLSPEFVAQTLREEKRGE